MATVSPALTPVELAHPHSEIPNLESSRSSVSWAAIVGGAVAASAATLVLVSLGSALGFASVSPWSGAGASLTALGVGAAIWLVVTQWLASAFGGYLAGRLRTKWAAHQSDEVFFRDTAHGFLAWGLSTMVVAWIAMSVAGGAANVAATVGAGAAVGAGQAADAAGPLAYHLDTLFRPNAPADTTAAADTAAPTETTAPAADATAPADATSADATAPAASTAPTASTASATANASTASAEQTAGAQAESGRILTRALTSDLSPADRTYVASLVSARTGLSQADSEARVDEVVTAAKQEADDARKAAGAFAFLTALSLLIGAFVASAAGAIGGRHRDEI